MPEKNNQLNLNWLDKNPLPIAPTDILDFDYYVVAFSGGKDCTASFLYLLECGVPKEKIELWHHLVDGSDKDNPGNFMDWPVTKDYCRKFAEEFGVPIYFSWREGGMKREILKMMDYSGRIHVELPNDETNDIECGLDVMVAPNHQKEPRTRMKFPQVSPDLRVRWCSSFLKIEVASAAFTGQTRFLGKKTLFISGERAEESPGRAKYQPYKKHRNWAKKRHIMHWLPVHSWTRKKVWDIIAKWRVIVHPAYYLGWGRLSCMTCIFGSPNQWASADQINNQVADLMATEDYLSKYWGGYTLHRTKSLTELVNEGNPYTQINTHECLRQVAASKEYLYSIIEERDWLLPAGAYADPTGPT